ncbi:hypothetical protein [Nostoc phage A1]|nr:hypothetical protein [Nostoc phage A1]
MMHWEEKPKEEKPKRYKKEWQLGDDGMMYEVDVEY